MSRSRLPTPLGDRPVLLLICLVGLLGPVPAGGQPQVDVRAAREYVQSLDDNFWEQAWLQQLETKAGRDGAIDWTYADRQQLGTLTDDYQQAIGAADGFWTNLQVQDYLQRQLLAVQPHPMMPGRPGAFRLRVLSTTTPNALALNDGTILLTTGLITTLHTEAQLRAVLAHEVAHVVLDHALATYRAQQKRSQARSVLTGLVRGVTSVVTPGLGGRAPLESTVYGLTSDLATRYLDREFIASAGLKYSREQERAANRLAQEWLLAHDHPAAALHHALRALEQAGRWAGGQHGATFAEIHPVRAERRDELTALLQQTGTDPSVLDGPAPPPDSAYDTPIAAVFEHEAEMDLSVQRFHSALGALDRTLQTEWTTSRTFLYKAIAVRNTTTDADGVEKALALLDRAEALADTPEPRIEAERALLRVRQGRPRQARRHLARCRDLIDQVQAHPDEPASAAAARDSLRTWAASLETRLDDQ